MEKEKYLDDLHEIKDMMSRSSRFISLSGASGIVAGSLALAGAYLAYRTVYQDQNYLSYRTAVLDNQTILTLLGIALAVLVLSFVSGLYLTQRKAKKNHQELWDTQAKRLMINLLIPLVTGGLLCLILLLKGFVGLLAPLTLLFYGLGLVNASKYTLSEIRSLGLIEIALGLIGCQFIGFGLLFWVVGFGIMHIIYGIVMHIKYDREGLA